MTTEALLLLQCVRAAIRGRPLADCRTTAVDWPRLEQLARHHKVESHLHWALEGTDHAADAPEACRSRWLLDYHSLGLRNAHFRTRAVDVLETAARRGIRVVPLKGLILGHTAYPRPELRRFDDIDLLVAEGDFGGLREVLLDVGYESGAPRLACDDLPGYSQCFRQIRFRADRSPPLEVHFRLFNLGLPRPTDSTWQDLEAFDLAGVPTEIPSTERFLLHLCLHAQQHGFARLSLLADIAVWQETRPIDWDKFVEIAKLERLVTAAWYSLGYAERLLGSECDARARRRLLPARWKRLQWEGVWPEQAVQTLQIASDAKEAELPLAFLLGDDTFARKSMFAWRVLFPRSTWLERPAGSAASARARHVARVLRSARQTFSRRVRSAGPSTWPAAL